MPLPDQEPTTPSHQLTAVVMFDDNGFVPGNDRSGITQIDVSDTCRGEPHRLRAVPAPVAGPFDALGGDGERALFSGLPGYVETHGPAKLANGLLTATIVGIPPYLGGMGGGASEVALSDGALLVP
jgi:hypothetical protein